MGFRGDWKATGQIFNLKRHYNTDKARYFDKTVSNNSWFTFKTLKVCWLCDASKGDDMRMCLTHVEPSAAWWETMYRTPPWEITPSYAQLRGFHQGMMMPDMLHVWSLGVARDLIGSSLKVMLQVQDVFDGGTIKARLKQASESLRSFARRRKYHLRIRKLTKSKLTWKTRKYPELCCSGYDSFVVGSWLEEILQPHSEKFPEITSMLWASNKAVSLMYAGNFFLTPGEKSSLEMLGFFFLKLYIRMANKAISEHKLLFRVRPKLHMLNHCFFSPRRANPAAYSTWMDEDYLKKMGKVLNVVNYKTAPKRVLQRWSLSLPEHLKVTLGD